MSRAASPNSSPPLPAGERRDVSRAAQLRPAAPFSPPPAASFDVEAACELAALALPPIGLGIAGVACVFVASGFGGQALAFAAAAAFGGALAGSALAALLLRGDAR